ncbi:hypothetical protein GCM10022232_90390 [Streptomyces plumbiresistens]|uniref:Uncharacterized protein n=1 Tax=Streptomyces plumbiresistens TaxID=511811 RepID=A0ABP7TSM5_9ACTN
MPGAGPRPGRPAWAAEPVAADGVQQPVLGQASRASLTAMAAMAAMTRAVTGSAQDQPRVALRTKPTRSTAERYVYLLPGSARSKDWRAVGGLARAERATAPEVAAVCFRSLSDS